MQVLAVGAGIGAAFARLMRRWAAIPSAWRTFGGAMDGFDEMHTFERLDAPPQADVVALSLPPRRPRPSTRWTRVAFPF